MTRPSCPSVLCLCLSWVKSARLFCDLRVEGTTAAGKLVEFFDREQARVAYLSICATLSIVFAAQKGEEGSLRSKN